MRADLRQLAVLLCLPLLALASACGGDSDDDDIDRTPSASVTTSSVSPGGTISTPDPITELKVSYINLHSPLTTNPDNQVAAETFSARIKQLAEEIRRLDPDIIAFSEASVTSAGNAIDQLVVELKLEAAYMRANPGFDLENQAAESIIKASGFEEGELIFSRYPILKYERLKLSPRSSELGEGRIALHARIKAPDPLGELDVFVTHLTGGGETIRRAQAVDLVDQIQALQSGLPMLLIGDMGDPVESGTYEVFRQAGFRDPGWEKPLPTCCREGVLGEQPELTLRTDCIMTHGLPGGSVQLFAQHPVTQPDGRKLYASDHNGLFAVFSLTPN